MSGMQVGIARWRQAVAMSQAMPLVFRVARDTTRRPARIGVTSWETSVPGVYHRCDSRQDTGQGAKYMAVSSAQRITNSHARRTAIEAVFAARLSALCGRVRL